MKVVVSLLLGALFAADKHPAVDFSPCEVVSSRAAPLCQDVHGNTGCRELLHIEVMLNGERLFLISDTNWRRRINYDLLPLGTYKIRLLKSEAPTAYMKHSQYELQYADGKTEQFELEGLAVR